MPKNKINLVLEIAISDRESFKILPDKKQQKRIYNQCLQRLKRMGLSGEALKFRLIGEIRSELFKLQPSYKPKENISIDEEDFFSRRPKFAIKGTRIWGNNQEEIDPIDQLEKNYNRTVEQGFRDVFCPLCHCERSCCRCHEEAS